LTVYWKCARGKSKQSRAAPLYGTVASTASRPSRQREERPEAAASAPDWGGEKSDCKECRRTVNAKPLA